VNPAEPPDRWLIGSESGVSPTVGVATEQQCIRSRIAPGAGGCESGTRRTPPHHRRPDPRQGLPAPPEFRRPAVQSPGCGTAERVGAREGRDGVTSARVDDDWLSRRTRPRARHRIRRPPQRPAAADATCPGHDWPASSALDWGDTRTGTEATRRVPHALSACRKVSRSVIAGRDHRGVLRTGGTAGVRSLSGLADRHSSRPAGPRDQELRERRGLVLYMCPRRSAASLRHVPRRPK